MKSRDYHLLSKYGITDADYEYLYRSQEGRCAVCRRHSSEFRRRLCLDHDHATGEIRGLLCIHCNRYIVGRHRRDFGAQLLKAAFDYLSRPRYTGWIIPKKKKRRCKPKKKKRLSVGVTS